MNRHRLTAVFFVVFFVMGALVGRFAWAAPATDPSMSLAIADGIVVASPAPSPSPAFTPIPADADPSALIPFVPLFLAAVERKDYAFAVGLALMILTALGMRFGPAWLPKEYAATGLLACSVFGGLGAALASGMSPYKAVFACLVISSTAIALWEGVGKVLEKLWKKHTSPDAGGGA